MKQTKHGWPTFLSVIGLICIFTILAGIVYSSIYIDGTTDTINVTYIDGFTSMGDIDMNNYKIINSPSLQETADYVIFKEGDVVKAKNSSGAIEFSSTNASWVIQSALDKGGSIFVKAGVYNITVSLSITQNNTYLFGEEGTIFRLANNAQTNVIVVSAGLHDITIRSLEIDGNVDNNPLIGQGYDECGVKVLGGVGQETSRVTISNLYIHDVAGTGIHFDDNVRDSLITHNIIENTYDGILMMWSDNMYITISHNRVKNTEFGIALSAAKYCSVINNVITDVAFPSILLDGDSNNNIVVGNTITATGAVTTRDGIWLDHTSHDNLVANNIIYNLGDRGIYIRGSMNNTIIGNKILECSQNGVDWHSGILITNFAGAEGNGSGAGNVLIGNTISGAKHKYNIEVSSSLSNNLFIALNKLGLYHTGQYFINSSNNYITNNLNMPHNYFYSNGENLISYWSFDEKSGSIVYDSQGTYDGIIYGANRVDGKFGKALEFKGDDYVDCGDDDIFNMPNAITVSAWIYPKSFASNDYEDNIVSKEDYAGGYTLRTGNGYPNFVVYIDGDWRQATSPDQISTNDWYHLVGTFDGSQVKIYVNGVLKATYDYSGSIVNSSFPLVIGKRANENNRYFNGTIDEVKIWNRSLTPEEIRAEYLLGISSHRGGGEKLDKTGGTLTGTLNTGKYLNITSTDYGTCDSSMEGIIVYNSTSKHFYGCNSTHWVQLD